MCEKDNAAEVKRILEDCAGTRSSPPPVERSPHDELMIALKALEESCKAQAEMVDSVVKYLTR